MSDQEPKFWSNAQTYGMALICLILGVAAGYLLHAPAVANANATISQVSAPASAATTPPQMPSAADMKRMADKQVAPLLADLEKHPNDADLLAKIAHAYMAAQRFQSAHEYYEKCVALKPKVDTLNELSFVYVKLGDLDRGIATLNKGIDNRSEESSGPLSPRLPRVERQSRSEGGDRGLAGISEGRSQTAQESSSRADVGPGEKAPQHPRRHKDRKARNVAAILVAQHAGAGNSLSLGRLSGSDALLALAGLL